MKKAIIALWLGAAAFTLCGAPFLAPAGGEFESADDRAVLYLQSEYPDSVLVFSLLDDLEEIRLTAFRDGLTYREFTSTLDRESGSILALPGYYKVYVEPATGTGRWMAALVTMEEALASGLAKEEPPAEGDAETGDGEYDEDYEEGDEWYDFFM